MDWAPRSSTADDVSQVFRSWLNAVAKKNIKVMSVTDDVFQLLRSWLNASADWNMPSMVITDDVSQLLRSPLNAVASSNILNVVVAAFVFHLEMSPLNCALPKNVYLKFVTLSTSQLCIGPCTPSVQFPFTGSTLRQVSTASLKTVLLSVGLPAYGVTGSSFA